MDTFKYLGITMSAEEGSEEAVRARVNAAWTKWRELSGVFFDKKMPRKLMIKLYMKVIRPVMVWPSSLIRPSVFLRTTKTNATLC